MASSDNERDVRRRWPQLRGEGCRNYREKLQQEIEAIFNLRLSGETLRVWIALIKIERERPPRTPPPQPRSEPRAESQER